MRLGPALLGWFTVVSVSIGGLMVASRDPAMAIERQAISEVELGRLLFWDPIMSGNKAVACATCHHPELAYTDGRELPIGFGGVGLGPERVDAMNGAIPVVRRNSPTLLNAVFNGIDDNGRGRRRRQQVDPLLNPATLNNQPMFWDSRVRGLEAQALEPLRTFEEMRGNTYAAEVAVDSVVARLRSIPEYVTHFQDVYGVGTQIDGSHIARAIVAFERTLVAMNSPFDRFRAGDTNAMTAQQVRGREEFEQAGCDECHDGVMFSDFDLVVEGIAENPLVAQTDVGAGRFRFRTPSLRNVVLTAPYMHNGMLATLEDVLEFYDTGRSQNPNIATNGDDDDNRPNIDRDIRRVDDLNDQERADIIAFLDALTDGNFDRTIPSRVPSGLQPGGLIGGSDARVPPAAPAAAQRPGLPLRPESSSVQTSPPARTAPPQRSIQPARPQQPGQPAPTTRPGLEIALAEPR